MPIPQTTEHYNDAVDIIIRSATKTVEVENKDGTKSVEELIDEEKLWWKTHDVSNEQFGRFAFELKEWERLASVALNAMPKERGEQVAREILEIGQSYRSSIDAKSSESRRDKNNAKSSLIGRISNNKIERIYTQKGEIKKGLFDTFTGKRQERDMEED